MNSIFADMPRPLNSAIFSRGGLEKGASLMTISGTFTTTNISKPVELQRTYQQPQTVAAQPQKPSFARRFDSVTISEENSQVFAKEAHSRLAREVRTATSSGSVSALREEIQRGNYHPDSMEIARNILLFGEGG